MAQYEHLPIYREAMRLAVHLEKVVRGFSRYHKYTLGSEMRSGAREIVAADFRDRVVHHYLVERLEQIFEPVFIHDSYACRVGKGVHAALARTREFIRSGTRNNSVALYALHLDVKNFFMTIDKRILANIVEERLVKEARRPPADGRMREILPFLNSLAKTIINHNTMAGRIDKGAERLLERIPPHKTLLHAPVGVGLPVGNLTSQFFANVYLNELDQHCKHTLKCRYYLRYCDDFLILDDDPKRLELIREEVRRFLATRLRLELNTRYAAITDIRNGIDFIGYIIRPDYLLVRRRSVNNLRSRLECFRKAHVRLDSEGLYRLTPDKESLRRLQGVMASYYGHFKWADTVCLRRSYFRSHPWLNVLFRLDRDTMPRVRRNLMKNTESRYASPM